MHLDSEKLAALLAGTLDPAEARALSAHLDGDCAQCEQLLAEVNVDALDGAADAAIASALPPSGGEGNDVEFARILRGAGVRGRPPQRAFLVAAIAASLVMAGVAGLIAGRSGGPPAPAPAWDGVKGQSPRAIPVRLRLLELDADRRMSKRASGEEVASGSSLLFEIETARPAEVALTRVSADGSVELIWRQRVGAGRTQLTVDGRPAAYPLAALAGPQRFVLAASEASLDDARLRGGAATLAPPGAPSGEAPALDGLSLDIIDIDVR